MGHSDEKIAVVDDTNKIIGYKLYRDVQDADTWRIVCVWIENSAGDKVLMQQRSFQKRLGPGLWTCAVEGTVEGDDDYEITARREVEEEIGLKEFKLIPAKLTYFKSSNIGSRFAHGFKIICDLPLEAFTIQEDELEDLQWLDKTTVVAELKARDPKYPANNPWVVMFDL